MNVTAVINFPSILPDELTLHEAASQAHAAHLHLVIDRRGRTLLTPIILPGMQKIAVLDKQSALAAA